MICSISTLNVCTIRAYQKLNYKMVINSWNPKRVPSIVTFVSVCLSVRSRATVWPRNLIFGLSDTWDIFLFFEIFIFTLFIGIFRFFPYITLVNFWFQAPGHSFSPRNVIFWLREPCTIENWRLLKKIENSIFYG